MTVDVGVLRAVLTLDDAPYRRGLAGISSQTRSQMAGLVSTVQSARTAVRGLVSALAVREVYQFLEGVARTADRVRLLQARLAGLSGTPGLFASLSESADRLGVSVEDAAQALNRFLIARRDIGLTVDEVVRLNEVVLMLGRISGASSQELAAGAMQLAQALASGTLQGDELRSVLENMPALARTLADQLGVGVGKLREMGREGELTGQMVAAALLRAADDVEARFAQLPETFDASASRLANSWSRFVEALDRELRVSDAFVFFTETLAHALDQLRIAIAGPDPGTFEASREIVRLGEEIADIERRIADLSGREVRLPWQESEIRALTARLAELRKEQDALIEASRRAAGESGETGATPVPSLTPKSEIRIPEPPVPRQAVLAEIAGEARIELERRLAGLQRDRLALEVRLANVGVEGADRIVQAKLREAEIREVLSGIADEETRRLAERYLREAQAVDELDERLSRHESLVLRVQQAADAVGDSFARAFGDAVSGARSAGEAFRALAADVAALATRELVTQRLSGAVSRIVGSAIGELFGPVPAGSPQATAVRAPGGPASVHGARGLVVDAGRVMPFAKGGIVTGPTIFPLRHGAGLMGEAGPEAVMPLVRTPSGDLGVRALAGDAVRPVEVVVQVVDRRTADAPPLEVSSSRLGSRQTVDVVVEDSFRRLFRAGRLRDVFSSLEGGRPAAR